MKINSLQESVLLRIRRAGPCGSYRLGATLNTLNALALKKLVKADRSNPGCFFSPRTAIIWDLTESGRQQIAHLDGDGLPSNS